MDEESLQKLFELALARLEASAAQESAYLDLKGSGEGKARFNRAVEIASIRLKDATKIDSTGIGVDFLIGQLGFHKYLPVKGPIRGSELASLVEAARKDYEAYQVLEWVVLAIPQCANAPPIKEWQYQKHLGLFPPPKRRSGSQSHQNVHRDTLIVGEIKSLTGVGFRATRNRAKKDRGTEDEGAYSACDVVSCALARSGKTISYEAVEAVWNHRCNLLLPKLLASLFPDMINKAINAKS